MSSSNFSLINSLYKNEVSSKPVLISEYYKDLLSGFHSDLDAAFEYSNIKYFFKNGMYCSLDGKQEYFNADTWPGVEFRKIDAICMWEGSKVSH